eukprot:9826686-Heterocapsa_arctica.AAC.1
MSRLFIISAQESDLPFLSSIAFSSGKKEKASLLGEIPGNCPDAEEELPAGRGGGGGGLGGESPV